MITFTGKRALLCAISSSFRKLTVDRGNFLLLYSCSYSSLVEVHAQTEEPRSGNADDLSFTANYLIKRFGFSRVKALASSKYLNFRSTEKPDSVVAFFKKHGFSDSQIKRTVWSCPTILWLNPENNLLPKIEFFLSVGVSREETVEILSSGRSLLSRSLNLQIIPCFNFIKNMFQSEKDAINIIRKVPNILEVNLLRSVPPNVESLKEAGVPEAKILYFFKRYPQCLTHAPPEDFKKSVIHIQDMGINPLRTIFVSAVFVMKTMTRLNWEKKMELYKRWGYSESQVLAAFRIYPFFMANSEKKMDKILDHIINTMGFDRSVLLSFPNIIALSLEKTVIPRCAVYKILRSKGLIRKNASITGLLKCSKKLFPENFVLPFVKEAPELLKLYPNTSK